MRRPRQTVRVLGSGAAVGAFALALLAAGHARGAETRPSGDAGQVAAPRVDAAHARQAHRRVRDRLAGRETRGDPIRVTGLTGVKVTLRWLGLTAGTGMHVIGPDPGVTDLADASAKAAESAIAGLRKRLSDAKQRAAIARRKDPGTKLPPIDGKGGVEAFVSQIASDVRVGLQLARRLQRVRVPSDAGKQAIYFTFAPGYHGLRLRAPAGKGSEAVAWVWPASALAHNQSPRGQMLALLRGAGADDPLAAFERIARPDGYPLQRFRVIHVVRPATHTPVQVLTRGHRVIPASAIDARTLEGIARRLGAFLQRRQRDDGAFRGTYHPSTDRYSPTVAPPAAGGLAVYALHRLAAARTRGWLDRAPQGAREAVRQGIGALLERGGDGAVTGSARGDAAVALTIAESEALAARKATRDRAAKALLDRIGPGGRLVGSDDKPLPPAAQGMAAAALAAVYDDTRGEAVKKALTALLEAAWSGRSAGSARAAAWLLRAGATARSLGLVSEAAAERRAKQARALARRLRRRQIRTPPAMGPADVLGGFRMTEPPAFLDAAPPNPDWRSTAMLRFLALHERGQPAAGGSSLVRGMLATRFLAQLMFDTPAAYYVPSPERVRGGVRRSLWDNRLTTAASAHGLLASLAFLERLLGDEGGDPAAPAPATRPARSR